LNNFTCALRVLGCGITVHCEDEASFGLLSECYSAFLQESIPESKISLRYHVSLCHDRDGWVMKCDEGLTHCPGTSSLLFEFEKNMTLRLQKLRTELFFVHAAVLSIDDRCVVISGASGSGKSTLAWSLCHLGFNYLSDELAPICPTHRHVEPYPHALCLKTEPLSGPSLPESTICTSATMHVPAYELPNHAVEQSSTIGAMVFIDSSRNGCSLELKEIGSAEAAARLYSNGLNQLAHIGDGLPAATRIASSVPSVFVTGGTVEERSRVVQDLLPV
jgi:hypothetical protein